MRDTERLQHALDDARTEHEAIHGEGVELSRQIEGLVKAYAARHSCDCTGTMEHIDDAIKDLVSDASGPSHRLIVRLEDEIGNLEYADLERNSPVVL